MVSKTLAYLASRVPVLEHILVLSCRRERPGAGRIARAYGDVLTEPTWRKADLGAYCLWVNVAEVRGIVSYFEGQPLTAFVLDEHIAPGDVCINGGANMGHYTARMAHLAGPAGHVIAFEPQAAFADYIRRSASQNGFSSIQVDERGLYSESGHTMSFYLGRPGGSGIASLRPDFKDGRPRDSHGTAFLETVTLADALPDGIDTVHLLKVDVEGMEVEVLRGAASML